MVYSHWLSQGPGKMGQGLAPEKMMRSLHIHFQVLKTFPEMSFSCFVTARKRRFEQTILLHLCVILFPETLPPPWTETTCTETPCTETPRQRPPETLLDRGQKPPLPSEVTKAGCTHLLECIFVAVFLYLIGSLNLHLNRLIEWCMGTSH